MFRVSANGSCSPAHRRLAFAATTLVTSNVQLLASVPCITVFGLSLGLHFILAASGAGISFSFFNPGFLLSRIRHCFCSNFSSLFFLVFLCLLFFLASFRFSLGLFFLLGLKALFGEGFRIYAVLFFLALAIEGILLVLSLLFEHVTFDVSALATYLYINGARPALSSREFKLGLRLALQCNLARCGRGRRRIVLTVTATQMRQQLKLRFIADIVIRTLDLDTGLVELRQQLVDWNFQNLSKLCNCHISHTKLRNK